MAAPTTPTTVNEYEAMFVLDNEAATQDWEATSGQVDAILEKHGAELVTKERWDERKLAYEIKGRRRATYYLVYFRAGPGAIAEMNQDLLLNQVVLRHLVIRLDEPIDVHVAKRTEERERLAEENRRASLAMGASRKGRGGRDRRDRDDGDDDVGSSRDDDGDDSNMDSDD